MKVTLFTPGPVEVPQKILEVIGRPIIHHRSKDFQDVFREVRENLKKVFFTKNQPLVLTSSGTGAMESAVSNFFSEGEKVLCINGGKFGERWVKIAKAFRLDVVEEKIPWGKSADPQRIREILKKDGKIKGVFIQGCETSTGAKHPIKEIGEVIREISDDILFVVDGITAVGVFEVRQDDWGIDVLIAGSQKAFMLPPGLAMISYSEKARKKMEKSNLPKFYFDLKREEKAQEGLETAFTPAIPLIFGLRESLKMILDEGIENVFKRHKKLQSMLLKATKALGLKIFPENPAESLTVIYFENFDAEKIRKRMRELGAWVAGGQDELKGKVIRITHMGYYFESDIIFVIGILEKTLKDVGFEIKIGEAFRSAIEN